jgi:hypothetical protein
VLIFFESNSVLTLFLQKVPNPLWHQQKPKMVDLWGDGLYIYVMYIYIIYVYVYVNMNTYFYIHIYKCVRHMYTYIIYMCLYTAVTCILARDQIYVDV